MVPQGSIEGHFGMLSLRVQPKGALVGLVACHWGFEAPSTPARLGETVDEDSQF
jgi:ABC-type transporter Mla maintaining outer membrane lipid asymmetry permease subunit MlaE